MIDKKTENKSQYERKTNKQKRCDIIKLLKKYSG